MNNSVNSSTTDTITLHIPADRILERVYALTAARSVSRGNCGDRPRRTPGLDHRDALVKVIEGAATLLAIPLMHRLADMRLDDPEDILLTFSTVGMPQVDATVSATLLSLTETALAYGVLEQIVPEEERRPLAAIGADAARAILGVLEPVSRLSLTPCWM